MPEWIVAIVFAVPIVAIIGGLSLAALRMVSQHRLMELAQKERIALIERGADPSKLPPPPDPGQMSWNPSEVIGRPFHEVSRRRAQNMTVGGIILLFVGMGLGVFIYYVTDKQGGPAMVGLVPASLGLALLLASRIVAADAAKSGPDRGSEPRP